LLLVLCLVAGCSSKTIDFSTEGPIVRLYYTPLHVIGFMAVHPHFITYSQGNWHRWEVWHTKNLQGGDKHVYLDLFELNRNVGQGSKIAMEWHGQDAYDILRILYYHVIDYPYWDEYWFWPGPNSNTFITWVLDQAKVEFDPPWQAWGSSY